MFPQLVWSVITYHANNWQLRAVSKKIAVLVERNFRFKYSDYVAILEKGTVKVAEMYYQQHPYRSYQFMGPRYSAEVVIYLLQKGVNLPHRFLNVLCRDGNIEIIKLYMRIGDLTDVIRNIYIGGNKTAIKFISGHLNKRNIWYAMLGAGLGEKFELLETLLQTNEFGYLPNLMCRVGNIKMIEKYCDLPLNVSNLRNVFSSGNLECIKWLDAKHPIPYNNEYMDVACAYGFPAIVEYLLEKKYIVTHDAVHEAAACGHLEVLKLVSRFYAGLGGGLYAAARYGHLPVVEYLMSLGYESKDMLTTACLGDHLDVVKFIIGDTRIGQNIIDVMCQGCCMRVLDYLSEKGYECEHCADFEFIDKCPLGRNKKRLISAEIIN